MDNSQKWATVTLKDGMIYEGIIESEAAHGLYFRIGGNQDRLCMWPWQNIVRVIYKQG